MARTPILERVRKFEPLVFGCFHGALRASVLAAAFHFKRKTRAMDRERAALAALNLEPARLSKMKQVAARRVCEGNGLELPGEARAQPGESRSESLAQRGKNSGLRWPKLEDNIIPANSSQVEPKSNPKDLAVA